MLKFSYFLRRSLLAALTIATWLSSEATAQAQGPLAQTGIAKTMIGWLLVLLAVGLGLMVVCRPTSRPVDGKKKKKGK